VGGGGGGVGGEGGGVGGGGVWATSRHRCRRLPPCQRLSSAFIKFYKGLRGQRGRGVGRSLGLLCFSRLRMLRIAADLFFADDGVLRGGKEMGAAADAGEGREETCGGSSSRGGGGGGGGRRRLVWGGRTSCRRRRLIHDGAGAEGGAETRENV
jgi:hypothetical protein